MLRWKRRVQGYTPEGSREFQVRIWGARGEGVKAGSESSDTASSIGTLSEAVSMWWKKVISLSNNEEGGENKIFQLFFFFFCSFLSFCVLLDYEMVSFHSGPSHTNVSGNWWSGNWYLHHGLQILGNTVTLGLTASIQIHPPEWLENQRVASGGGQSEGMSSQFRPKNGYFLAFIVVVSKRKADGTWTLKMNLEMKAIVKGKMLCNNFFSLMWIF